MKNSSFPLTQPQERIWYTQQIYPDSSMFNIGGIVLIHGVSDLDLLMEAINNTIRLHDAFWLQLSCSCGNIPLQYLAKQEPFCTELIDFSTHTSPKTAMERYFQRRFENKFELYDSPLFEFVVFKVSDKLYGYFIKLHHIIADGWSVQILTRDIGKAYNELLQGQCNIKMGSSYVHFIKEDQEYINSQHLQKDKSFWGKQFNSLPTKTRDVHEGLEGKRATFYLDEKITTHIKNFCKENSITVNSFMIGLYASYKYKHEYNRDIVIGVPVLGRLGKNNRNTIGMYVSSIPIRLQMRDDETPINLLRRVGTQIAKTYRHQRYSYHRLVHDLGLNNQSLYSECINYYGTSMYDDYGGYSTNNLELYNGQQQYNLQIIIRDWENGKQGFQIDIDYKTKLYTDVYIESIFENIKKLADIFVSNDSVRLKDIELIPINYHYLYPEFNQSHIEFPIYDSIISFIRCQVNRYPTKTAIQCGDNSITYADLDRLSDGMALFLKRNQIRNGEIIGIYMSRSIEAIIAILGILKAGCIFLPIDPQNKADRMSYMLENANASILIHNLEIPNNLSFTGKIFTACLNEWKNQQDEQKIDISYKNEVAYIVYTSGSTGLPKGVVVSNENLLNYILWASKAYNIQPEDIWPLYSSLGFDLTITSIFTPLVTGGSIVIYDDSTKIETTSSGNIIEHIMEENLCTVLKLTPSHLFFLKEEINAQTSIKKLIVGGENLRYKLAKSIHEQFKSNVVIYNEYGPTEATVGCMVHQFDPNQEGEFVPIGRPSSNNRIYLLNKYLEPVPHGEKGEIFISGRSVATGYINNPTLTSDRFIRVSDDMILYKTGDIARFIDSHTLICYGRNDSQVKIMGYRIEPNEVAYVLQNHKQVEFSEVVTYTDTRGQEYLCAYYTGGEILKEKLDRFMSEYLPSYMLPSDYVWLDSMPLTMNGKVDREALSVPQHLKIDLADEDILSNVEKSFLDITKQVLKRENIGLDNNFYQLGGDSIKAVQISSRLHEIGLGLKVKDILNVANIGEILKYILVNTELPRNQEVCSGSLKHTPIIDWFFKLNLRNPNRYCQYCLLVLEEPLDLHILEEILQQLIRHHDGLRLNYDSETKQLFYNNRYINEPVYIKEFTKTSSKNVEDNYKGVVEQLIYMLDIMHKPLIQTAIVNDSERFVWCIVVHHLAIDGVSWRILLEDIDTLIGQYRKGDRYVLPKKTDSYQRWAKNVYFEKHIDYNSQTENQVGLLNEHIDYTGESLLLYSELPDLETSALFNSANVTYRTTPIEIMLSALILTIPNHLNYENTVIEVEFHGRDETNDINISRTVGWFTRISLFEISKKKMIHDAILDVKNTYRKLLQQNSFTPLVFSETEKNIIRFNYLGDITGQYNHFVFLAQQSNINENTAAIEMDLALQNGKLVCQCRINSDILNIFNIDKFCDSYIKTLSDTLVFCLQQDDVILTPSDFDMVDLTDDELRHLIE